MANKAAVTAYKANTAQGDYTNAAKEIKKAYTAAIKRNNAKASSEKKNIKKEYDAKRADTYVNARLSAISNNEGLAKEGLAGGLYDGAKSGVSETSRIAQDNVLRKNLNNLNVSEAKDKNNVDLEALIAGYDADAEQAKSLSELYVDKAAARTKDAQFAAQYALDNYEAYLAAIKLQNDMKKRR